MKDELLSTVVEEVRLVNHAPDLLDLVSGSVDPALRSFEGWAMSLNGGLTALRDRRSTQAFPVALHLSFVRGTGDAEALVVSISVARRGAALIGRADVSTGEGVILAECDDVEFVAPESPVAWESCAGRLAHAIRAMLESAKTSPEVQLALA